MTLFSSQVPSFSAGQSAPSQRPYTVAPGVKAVFLGDSITHGSSSYVGQRFVDQIPKILGTAIISSKSVEKGVPGQNSAQMLARYNTDVRANGAQIVFLLAGTNDAGQGVSLAQYAANIKGIAAECRKDGIPLIIATVPPRGASAITTPIKILTAQYNAWINAWAPGAGVTVADVYANLCQSTGEQMAGGYDSGDGVHPETLGHQKIAEAFVDAFTKAFGNPSKHIVQTPSSFNLISNGLFLSNSSGWYEQPGGTGTAPSYSQVTDTTGKLAYGKWQQMDFDCTAAGGLRYFCNSISGLTPGNTLLVTCRLDLEDVAGGYYSAASGITSTAQFNVDVRDGSFISKSTLASRSVRTPGAISALFTLPAGQTQVIFTFTAQLPTGQHARYKIGEVGIFDVTALPDLANLI